jgi:hypothetical protein
VPRGPMAPHCHRFGLGTAAVGHCCGRALTPGQAGGQAHQIANVSGVQVTLLCQTSSLSL